MQNGTDLDEVSRNAVIDGKGEPAHQGATKPPVHGPASQRHPGDVAERAVEFALELSSEPVPARFILRKSLRDIRRGFWGEFQPILHGFLSRSFARTSSHVSLGPGAGLSSRRSSSALCQSGIGTSSGVAARLSQISSNPIWQSRPTLRNLRAWKPNGSRLSCGALRKDSFHNLRAPSASSAC